MNITEQCPKCGSFIQGAPAYETKRQGVRTGVKWATKKLLIFILSPLIGTILGPLGTISGLIVAFIIVAFITKMAEGITESIDQEIFTTTTFEFQCSQCGATWKRTYEKGVDITTDAVLKWQKDSIVEKFRSEARSSLITAVICGIISFYCGIYCVIKDSGSKHMENTFLFGWQEVIDVNWTWWFLFIIGIISIIITFYNGSKSHDKSAEADNLENMSISEFRHSNYRPERYFVGNVKDIDNVERQVESYETPKKYEAPKEYDLPKQDKIKTESEAPKEYHAPKKNIETIIFKEPEQPKAKQEITIGRSESCDIRFDENDVYASTYHGSIFIDGSQLMFKDTSTNGTIINNRMVRHTTVPINRGDSIIIADKYPISWSQINAFFPPSKTYQQTVPITNEDRQRYEVPQQASPSPIYSPNYQSQPQQDIYPQREATLFCPYCGKEIPATVSYCVYCNRPIPSNLSKRLH